MITNPNRLLINTAPGSIEVYKLGLLRFNILDEIARHYDITITSAFRTMSQQKTLRDAAGNLIPAAKKAKSVSQHVLAEAVDFACPNMSAAYDYLHKYIPTWQLFLYIDEGLARSIHVSMPSERVNIDQKSLLNVDGVWSRYEGRIPVVRV